MTDRQPAQGAIQPSTFTPLEPGAHHQRPRLNPLKTGVVMLLLASMFALWFLFTARSVQVIVNGEQGGEVDFSGGLVVSLGQRQLMRAGNYQLNITAEGFHSLDTSIEVSAQDSQDFAFSLRPLPGFLRVASQPEGAQVTLDEKFIGATPVELADIEAGNYTLQLSRERYLPVQQTLTITGRRQRQQVEIALEPAWAEVNIDSQPTAATILVDGEVLAATPANVEILEGKRQLSIQLPGYAAHQQTLDVIAGQAITLPTIALTPATGLIQLTSTPSRANVTLNGEFAGQTPLQLELTPDTSHRISLSKAGYQRLSRDVRMSAGEQRPLTLAMQAQLGKVVIQVNPPQARVLINGKLVGAGSQTLSLPALEQVVSVELAGYASFRQRFTPRPGLEQRIDAKLQTQEQATLARIPPEAATSLGHTLILLRGGELTMGAARREPGRRANEILRPVALKRLFYMATTEVTNAQFRLFEASHNSGQIQGNSLDRENHPAVKVSWQHAAMFCNWLSREEGIPPFYTESGGIITGFKAESLGYRLPSEAEWAFAARQQGKVTLRFPWGDSYPPPGPVANYADVDSAYITGRTINNYKDSAIVSAAVGSYPANHNGLYDMGGNVAEWIHDIYAIEPGGANTSIDPLGPQSGANHTIRGSSWAHGKISQIRLAFRDYGERGRDDVGFRLARYAE